MWSLVPYEVQYAGFFRGGEHAFCND